VTIGIIGHAVGASFAVLVAEELFASGCRFLISVTSAGEIVPLPADTPTRFILIERALRDEGTSYHYLPPSTWSTLRPHLRSMFTDAFQSTSVPVTLGATWTTDGPFRETASAITRSRERGVLAVEMEAAALYAFAQATGNDVACFAQVTNKMATVEGDFEKEVFHSLEIVSCAARQWIEH
jgi:uridine phosphorylase